jgi:hypothetical protein
MSLQLGDVVQIAYPDTGGYIDLYWVVLRGASLMPDGTHAIYLKLIASPGFEDRVTIYLRCQCEVYVYSWFASKMRRCDP